MDLTFYVVLLKLKESYRSLSKSALSIIINLFLLLLSVSYAWGISKLIDHAASGQTKIHSGVFIQAVMGAIILLTFIRGFIPSYKPLNKLIQSFYPVSPVKRNIIELAKDYVSPYFVFVTVFIFCTYSFSHILSQQFVFHGVLSLLGAHILRRIIQNLAENKFKPTLFFVFFGLTVCLITLTFLFANYLLANHATLNALLVFILLFALNLAIESSIEEEKVSCTRNNSIKNFALQLLLNKKVTLITILISFIVKIGLLSVYHYLLLQGSQLGSVLNIVIYVFISPVLLFNYVFNNTWGYYSNLWLQITLTTDNFKVLIKNQLKLIGIPLLLDFMLMLAYFAFIDQVVQGVTFYLSSAFILFSLAVSWSIYHPIYVNHSIVVKANNSPLANFTAIVLILLLAALVGSIWFYLLIPVYLITGIAIIKKTKKTYNTRKYNMFEKLYKL